MMMSKIRPGMIDDHFDRAITGYLDDGTPDPIMAIEWTKNSVPRDVDTRRFVSQREAEDRKDEHSEACPCLQCSKVCDDD